MKKSVWLILALSSMAGASPPELLSQKEKEQIAQVRDKYQLRNRYEETNSRLSQHSADVYKYLNLTDLESIITQSLTDMVLTTEVAERETYDAISDNIYELMSERSSIHTTIKEKYSNLGAIYQEILSEFEDLEVEESKKKSELMKIYDRTISRLEGELSKSYITVKTSGNFKCDISKSLKSCIDRNRGQIKNNILSDSIFFAQESYIDDLSIDNAALDISGNLNYTATIRAKATFNRKVVSALNKEFGFESARITLVSNQEAEWYVNGKQVGQGKRKSIELPMGTHAILASYQGITQSSIEHIVPGKEYRYNLNRFTTSEETVFPTPGTGKPVTEQKSDSAVEKSMTNTTKPIPLVLPPDQTTEDAPVSVITPLKIEEVPSEFETDDLSDISYRLVHTNNQSNFYLAIGSEGTPVLYNSTLAKCRENWGRLITLKEYLDFITSSSNGEKFLKYNINTSDNQLVRVMDSNRYYKAECKGIAICVKHNQL